MKHIHVFILTAFLMLFGVGELCSTASAYDFEEDGRIVWSKRPGRNGLYSSKSRALGENFSVAIDGLYYYGDMEVAGFSLKSPTWKNLGAHLSANYHQDVLPALKVRYTLGGGYMRGDNEKAKTTTRTFYAYNAKAAVGVEWYPIFKAGFYIYAGVALQYSNVHYDVYGESGTDHTFLPMIPIELGYDFHLNQDWCLGIHLGVSQGLLDINKINLDGWPSENFGNSNLNKWMDGYMYLGVSVSWSWQRTQCAECRLAEDW